METYEIPESRSPFDLMMDDVADGNAVELRRGGRPVAVVLSVAEYDALVAAVR